jgi:peptidyl-prolyl cis-trans isomerase SurA
MDALKVNEVSQVIQSPFGMHLIEVLERRERDVSAERQARRRPPGAARAQAR